MADERTPKVTFSILDVRAVYIRGEGGGSGVLPKAGDLPLRFSRWLTTAKIYEVSGLGGRFGGSSSCLMFFTKKDAAKVRAWLEKNGAVHDEKTTWERRS